MFMFSPGQEVTHQETGKGKSQHQREDGELEVKGCNYAKWTEVEEEMKNISAEITLI